MVMKELMVGLMMAVVAAIAVPTLAQSTGPQASGDQRVETPAR
jgi:hypothetical protein